MDGYRVCNGVVWRYSTLDLIDYLKRYKIYLHFHHFSAYGLHSKINIDIEILCRGQQGYTYVATSISCLLISRWRKRPKNHQSWYWPNFPWIFWFSWFSITKFPAAWSHFMYSINCDFFLKSFERSQSKGGQLKSDIWKQTHTRIMI